jgi:FtsP/CotA-like multicopper oxidase with cupredoxin domain
MKRALPLLAPLLAAALLLSGCGVRTTHKSLSAAPVSGGTGFTGGPLRVREGDKVVIKVGNLTNRTHGFAIDAFGVKTTVDPGKKIDVKFTPTEKGTYLIYCQLHPTHKTTSLTVR